MNIRDFSDSIKFEVVKDNLRRFGGSICCEICKRKLSSIDECHFDHIYPFAKGGKSTLDNCQILCSDCNLRKNDKELKDFVLEEKARQFLAGSSIDISVEETKEEKPIEEPAKGKMTKEIFDQQIRDFIERKGDIHKVDFGRAYNHLPSVHYVKVYYGGMNTMKKAFGIEDISLNWDRERIRQTLTDYISLHGDVKQSDLKKENGLPSVPCILKYYPEYKSFTELKKNMLGLSVRHEEWTKEDVIEAGKKFVEENGKITESDCRSKNNLPTMQTIYKYFGTFASFQRVIGAPITFVSAFISKQDIETALNEYFEGKDRIVESSKDFFASFPYSKSTIDKRYGSITKFFSEYGITVIRTKKSSYTKKEVDDSIHAWIKEGNGIPKVHELTKLGLPSSSVILRYYEDWKEPFVMYMKIFDEANRN